MLCIYISIFSIGITIESDKYSNKQSHCCMCKTRCPAHLRAIKRHAASTTLARLINHKRFHLHLVSCARRATQRDATTTAHICIIQIRRTVIGEGVRATATSRVAVRVHRTVKVTRFARNRMCARARGLGDRLCSSSAGRS